MYRSVSALILCGTLGFAFAPHAAAARDAVCVRTSLGTVACGQMVSRREASSRQHYQTRQAVTKHSWVSRDRGSRYVDQGAVTKTDSRGHLQARRYERAGSDYFRKTGHQTTVVDPAKRARVQQTLYSDRPRDVASRGVDTYSDPGHKPAKRAAARNIYVEPQKTWRQSSEQHQTATRGSRNVVYRSPSHGPAKRTRQDVYSDDAAQPKGGNQVDDHAGQGDQDQPDRN